MAIHYHAVFIQMAFEIILMLLPQSFQKFFTLSAQFASLIPLKLGVNDPMSQSLQNIFAQPLSVAHKALVREYHLANIFNLRHSEQHIGPPISPLVNTIINKKKGFLGQLPIDASKLSPCRAIEFYTQLIK